jgi:hypothetical protein
VRGGGFGLDREREHIENILRAPFGSVSLLMKKDPSQPTPPQRDMLTQFVSNSGGPGGHFYQDLEEQNRARDSRRVSV